MDASLPPKKRPAQSSPPPPPSALPPPPPHAPTEASKIRGVAPPRKPRVGPQYQADVRNLR